MDGIRGRLSGAQIAEGCWADDEYLHAPADVDALLQVLEDVKAALTADGPGPEYRIGDALTRLAEFDADWLNGREASDD